MRQRFIQSFPTSQDIQSALDNKELGKPYVAFSREEQSIDWNSKEIDYTGMPLTFEIISGGTIVWKSFSAGFSSEIEYTTNNGQSWNSLVSTEAGAEINVNAGDVVQFRGNATIYVNETERNGFSGTSLFNTYGNPLSIIHKDDFSTILDLREKYTFGRLFNGCSGLVNASNMVLPATGLSVYCYQNMFDGCSRLTEAPELPATILNDGCYMQMFVGCTSLTTAPELKASTLVNNCYRQMFSGCTSLNYIKCLATNPDNSSLTNAFTLNWVSGVASNGTFIRLAGSGWIAGSGFSRANGIPLNWTIIDAEI